jgi:hypothetical protein
VSIPLNHRQGPAPAPPLDRTQVYPSRHETGSEGVPQGVPCQPVESSALLARIAGPERVLSGLDGPRILLEAEDSCQEVGEPPGL